MSDTAEVITIPPKVLHEVYKRHNITITFVVGTKRWQWEFEHHSVTPFQGDAKSLSDAKREAHKLIDKLDV